MGVWIKESMWLLGPKMELDKWEKGDVKEDKKVYPTGMETNDRIVPQLVTEFPDICETRRFITLYRRARHCVLS
jgi:hypothetical protein